MNVLILLSIACPLLAGLIVPACVRGRALRPALALCLALQLLLVEMACFFDAPALTVFQFEGALSLRFSVDGFGKLFATIVGVMWLLAGTFSFEYMKKERNQPRYFRYFLLTGGALVGVSFAANLFTFFVMFEAMTLLSMPLILHEQDAESRTAGLAFLGYSIVGASLALIGLFTLSHYGTSTEFTPGGVLSAAMSHGHENLLLTVYLLMAVGFGAKAGLFPLHAWLPIAHPVAPSPASAVLSGVITKAGVLGILRTTHFLFGADFLRGTWAQTAMLALALLTIFMGSMMAFRETLIKRRLAYSTVSQVSYAVFGILLLNEAGMMGAMLQVIFHAVAKDALFLWAGATIYLTGHKRSDELRGLGRRMPVAMGCFVIASLSLVGIPPFGGFVSKWYLATGALSSGLGVLSVIGPAVLILSALLTAGYLLPIAANAFFPGKDVSLARIEEPPLMTGPLIALSALAIIPGTFTGALTQFIGALLGGLFS